MLIRKKPIFDLIKKGVKLCLTALRFGLVFLNFVRFLGEE